MDFSVAQMHNVLSNFSFIFHFRNFVNTFIQFKKPIIVAVNGPAIGLGASILPLCDVVWANEKAWFQTPYTTFGQSPDGCSTVMFPKIMGGASVSTSFLKIILENFLKKSSLVIVFLNMYRVSFCGDFLSDALVVQFCSLTHILNS